MNKIELADNQIDTYPRNGAYCDLLRWHLKEWHTHPEVTKVRPGPEIDLMKFANDVHRAKTAREGYNAYKNLINWITPGKAPPKGEDISLRIQRELFYNREIFAWNSDLEDWADELWAARRKHYSSHTTLVSYKDDLDVLEDYDALPLSNIPDVDWKFLGRDAELDDMLARASHENPSFTIFIRGGLGVGKTELSKAFAFHKSIVARFNQRRWFVGLEAATTADAMQEAIVRAIGRDSNMEFPAAVKSIAGAPVLLILDHLDSLLGRSEQREEVLSTLNVLFRAEKLSVVISCRSAGSLSVAPVSDLNLLPLVPPSALKLFAAHAGRWVLEDPKLSVVMDEMGGNPIAISFAQRARGRASLEPLLDEWKRIGNAFALSSEPTDDRHSPISRSIEIALCAETITLESKSLFAVLGRLPAGIDLKDIQAVTRNDAAFSASEALITAGLAFETKKRISLISPVRDYCKRSTTISDEAQDAWLKYYLSLLRLGADYVGTLSAGTIVGKLKEDFLNIEAALYRCLELGRGDDFINLLDSFLDLNELTGNGTRFFQDLAYSARLNGTEFVEHAFLTYAGEVHLRGCRARLAELAFRDALKGFIKSEIDLGKGVCYRGIGNAYFLSGKFEDAISHYRKAITLFKRVNDPFRMATVLLRYGSSLKYLKRYDESYKYLKRALKLFDLESSASCYLNCKLELASISVQRGDFECAVDIFQECHDLYFQAGDVIGRANTLEGLAGVASKRGDHDLALSYLDKAFILNRDVRNPFGMASCLWRTGATRHHAGNKEWALSAYMKALPIYQQLQDERGIGHCYVGMGDALVGAGGNSNSLDFYRKAHSSFKSVGDAEGIQICLNRQFDLRTT